MWKNLSKLNYSYQVGIVLEGWEKVQLQSHKRPTKSSRKHSEFYRQRERLVVCDTDMQMQSDEGPEGCFRLEEKAEMQQPNAAVFPQHLADESCICCTSSLPLVHVVFSGLFPYGNASPLQLFQVMVKIQVMDLCRLFLLLFTAFYYECITSYKQSQI